MILAHLLTTTACYVASDSYHQYYQAGTVMYIPSCVEVCLEVKRGRSELVLGDGEYFGHLIDICWLPLLALIMLWLEQNDLA